jgi:hypothetical protein
VIPGAFLEQAVRPDGFPQHVGRQLIDGLDEEIGIQRDLQWLPRLSQTGRFHQQRA